MLKNLSMHAGMLIVSVLNINKHVSLYSIQTQYLLTLSSKGSIDRPVLQGKVRSPRKISFLYLNIMGKNWLNNQQILAKSTSSGYLFRKFPQ